MNKMLIFKSRPIIMVKQSMLSINCLKRTLKYNSWIVSFKYHLVSFYRLTKPCGDQIVMNKISSSKEEFNDSEGIIIYSLWKFSKESNKWSTFSFISPLEVSLFNMWVEYFFISVLFKWKCLVPRLASAAT